MHRSLRSGLASCAAVALVAVAGQSAFATTILVDPANMGTWSFANSDGSGNIGLNPTGVGQMVVGPASPPIGTGSANLATGNGTTGGDGAEILSTTGYAGDLLSSLTALSYSTYDTLNNGSQFPYLELEVSYTSGNSTAYDQLFFEPPYQTPASGNPGLPDQGDPAYNEWQSWNAFTGGWWDNQDLCGAPGNGGPGNQVESLATCISALPGATIVNFNPSLTPPDGVGGIRLNVGFANPTDQFNGYVDDFTIGVDRVDATYNFDPSPASVPEPGSLILFAGGLLATAGALRRRLRKPAST